MPWCITLNVLTPKWQVFPYITESLNSISPKLFNCRCTSIRDFPFYINCSIEAKDFFSKYNTAYFLAADTPIENFKPTPRYPALQYLESVEERGNAYIAGLRSGDYILKVSYLKACLDYIYYPWPWTCSLDPCDVLSVLILFYIWF